MDRWPTHCDIPPNDQALHLSGGCRILRHIPCLLLLYQTSRQPPILTHERRLVSFRLETYMDPNEFCWYDLALCRKAKLNNGDDAGVPSRSCQKQLDGFHRRMASIQCGPQWTSKLHGATSVVHTRLSPHWSTKVCDPIVGTFNSINNFGRWIKSGIV